MSTYIIQFRASGKVLEMCEYRAGGRAKFVNYVATFSRPIVALFEQATPITEAVRGELKSWPGTLSNEAREFAFPVRYPQ